jgi:hypothetical protein
MVRKLSLLLSVVSALACNPFNKAERRIDNPNGKTSNTQSVQTSVQKGSLQSNSSSIIDNATSNLVLPFANIAPRTGLEEMLSAPMLQSKVPYAKTIANLTQLALANSATPYALVTTETGSFSIPGCSGDVSFSTAVDLDGLGLRGDVEVTMAFNQIVCLNPVDNSIDGSIDGEVAFRAEFDTLAASLKIINLIEATVSNGVETQDIDFAFRLDGSLLTGILAFDMSVEVDGKFYTISVIGDLETGSADLVVTGKDGQIDCVVTNSSVACTGIAAFDL